MPSDADAGQDNQPLTIQALDASGVQQPTTFRVRYNTKMHKLMGAYAMSQNLSLQSLEFRFEDRIIEPFQTPRELNMPVECCVVVRDRAASSGGAARSSSNELGEIKLPPRPVRPQQRQAAPQQTTANLVGGGVNSPMRGQHYSSIRDQREKLAASQLVAASPSTAHTAQPHSPLGLPNVRRVAARVPQDLNGQETQRHKVSDAYFIAIHPCTCT
jgi:hypothetical protein